MNLKFKKFFPKLLKIIIRKTKSLFLNIILKKFKSSLKSIFSFKRNFAFIYWYQLSKKKIIKLELGSGDKKGLNGFTTVDMGDADIKWDLKNGIPLKDNSVDLIYSSHLLEHIPFKELILFLNECRRVLKKNGVFSVCVPNARNYINAYMKGETFKVNNWINTGSKLDQVNYMAYMDGHHKYLFDEENLIKTLLSAGFRSAELRNFDSNLDIKERDFESIYALARKF